jgi:hypothetical protein
MVCFIYLIMERYIFFLKNKKEVRAGIVAHLVEFLTSKHEALSSNLHIVKRKKNKTKIRSSFKTTKLVLHTFLGQSMPSISNNDSQEHTCLESLSGLQHCGLGVADCHRDKLKSDSFKKTTGHFTVFISQCSFLIWNSVYATNINIDFP